MPDNSVDAVVTDPPYADNVMYSELSNFFYVWLRIALRKEYEFFAPELVPWEKEVIANSSQGKGREEFLESLTRIFRESNRVLKKDGLLVFTFHHRKTDAWAALLQSILDSGYQVRTVYPVRSEMRASTHLQGVESIKYDLVVVCRKRGEIGQDQSWTLIRGIVRDSTRRLIRELHRQGEPLDRVDRRTILLGKCMEAYSRYYPRVVQDGRRVSVLEALDSVRNMEEFLPEGWAK
jgi:adenine-specific DNA methylase